MAIKTNLASLVEYPIDEQLRKLHEELRQIRSEAISSGQFGGSRMALATYVACENALALAAETVFEQLQQLIKTDMSDTRQELIGEAKDSFMKEFSRFKDKIEQAQQQNSGSYYQAVPIDKLIQTYLARVDTLCVSVLNERKRFRKNEIFHIFKCVLSMVSRFFKS